MLFAKGLTPEEYIRRTVAIGPAAPCRIRNDFNALRRRATGQSPVSQKFRNGEERANTIGNKASSPPQKGFFSELAGAWTWLSDKGVIEVDGVEFEQKGHSSAYLDATKDGEGASVQTVRGDTFVLAGNSSASLDASEKGGGASVPIASSSSGMSSLPSEMRGGLDDYLGGDGGRRSILSSEEGAQSDEDDASESGVDMEEEDGVQYKAGSKEEEEQESNSDEVSSSEGDGGAEVQVKDSDEALSSGSKDAVEGVSNFEKVSDFEGEGNEGPGHAFPAQKRGGEREVGHSGASAASAERVVGVEAGGRVNDSSAGVRADVQDFFSSVKERYVSGGRGGGKVDGSI